MELKRKLKKIVNIVSIFLIVGCSYYSMAGSIPANIKNVNIPLIENDTAEFEISENLTSKITQEIAIQNILKRLTQITWFCLVIDMKFYQQLYQLIL